MFTSVHAIWEMIAYYEIKSHSLILPPLPLSLSHSQYEIAIANNNHGITYKGWELHNSVFNITTVLLITWRRAITNTALTSTDRPMSPRWLQMLRYVGHQQPSWWHKIEFFLSNYFNFPKMKKKWNTVLLMIKEIKDFLLVLSTCWHYSFHVLYLYFHLFIIFLIF